MIRHLLGDCREVLATLPEKSVHCVVTSPPYWGLRDYGVDGQLGLERTPEEYIANMVEVLRGVHRVLRDDGTLWVNVGDSYAGSWGAQGRGSGLKPKDLVGIPWLLAFALRDVGWYLRQEIIWHKRNPMAESVTDRCTKAHEQIFLLTKRPRYYFDHIAIQERAAASSKSRLSQDVANQNGSDRANGCAKTNGPMKAGERRNKRSVWRVSVAGYKGAHFAVFPPKLITPCILAGTSEFGCCAACGAPYRRITEKRRKATRPARESKVSGLGSEVVGNRDPGRHIVMTRTVGWERTCRCETAEIARPVVLDPFGGTGTTGEVAANCGCDCILIDLKPEYIEMQKKRNAQSLLL